ncbi:unnamed protein product [Lasius platythorax]|uniref:Tyrosine-protein kinase receptor n=1 Tax=Lasius platythorax TaxID=488582 RepID=A0AAV2NLF8_9HYME
MLRVLKTLCVLLKVLMLTRGVIVSSSEDLENSDISTFQINDHNVSSNVESVQNYSASVIVRNKVESLPSEPTFLRAFVEFDHRLHEEDNIIIKFRWKQPKFRNGVIQTYSMKYSFENENKYVVSVFVTHISAIAMENKVENSKPDTIYYYQVRALNEVDYGPYTSIANVSTTHENPVPLLLISSWNGMKVLDVDLQTDFISTLNKYRAKEIAYSALDHKIYWINDKSELMTGDFNPNAIERERNYTKIADLDTSAHNLCIDWITRNLYWIEFSNQTSNIMKLDLTLWQQSGTKAKYDNILKINELKFLNVLPSIGYLHWMELNTNNQYEIMHSNLDGKNMKPFSKSKYDKCFCPYKLLEASSMKIDNTNINKPLMYWTSNDRLIAADIYGCRCKLILSAGDQIFFNYLTIDKTNIYLFSSSEQLIYILKKKYALLESKENAFTRTEKLHFSLPYIYQIIALDRSLQPHPQMICKIPKRIDYHVKVETITSNSIVVNLPEPVPNIGCEKKNLAPTKYTISVSHCLDNNELKEFNVQTYELQHKIQNLTPFTEYTLKLALSNFYVDKLWMGLQFGADVILRTIPGKLNAPEIVTVQILTPTLAKIYWMPPKKLNCVAVNYEVHWMSVLVSNGTQKITYQMPHYKQLINNLEQTVDGKVFTKIQLLPGQEYLIYVRVYPANFSEFFTDSLNKSIYMYSEPNNLTLSGVNANGMNISWIPSRNLTTHYILEYKNDTLQEWQKVYNTEKNNVKVTYYIENLLPRTLYKFRLILRYPEYMEDFIWPPDDRFTFETLGNVPSAPGIPTVTRLPNLTYQLNWEAAQAHDSQVTLYRLECLIVENNYKNGNQINKNEHWLLCYNGTDNYWVITRDMKQKCRFRVKAQNAYGFGVWSESSVVVDLTESIEISTMQYYLPLILSFIVALLIYVLYFIYSYRQRKGSNEIVLPLIMTDIDRCRATLNDIHSENVQLNPIYAPSLQCKPDEFVLTIIEKKQITLEKFLGSGKFGKVFEGTVKDLEGLDTTPVAIKMLRKNASPQEKEKFLQEAELMSHFRHKHVLKLLGICLEVDSSLIILELMDAGDLLKYLRESRTLQPSDSNALRLQDLLAMCEDVARGCCYLEKLQFVHRDLACRNCLVSAKNRENRIVKIGDFGLARDIYKDDYYRIEGKDGLLPVRWMAPESLMYRTFTSQSDVWAFGVLMWEITSLGEHPYAAKNNSEVLQYVCEGGKLSKPFNCPSTLYQLMQHCWYALDDRPNFIFCLKNIIMVRDNIEDTTLNSTDNIRYTELPPSGQIEDIGRTSETQHNIPPND